MSRLLTNLSICESSHRYSLILEFAVIWAGNPTARVLLHKTLVHDGINKPTAVQ